jgi:hypothetical protein
VLTSSTTAKKAGTTVLAALDSEEEAELLGRLVTARLPSVVRSR